MLWSGATVSILQKVSYRKYLTESILQKVSWPRSFPSRSRRARPVRYRGPALEGAGYEPHELKKKRTPQRQHTPWEQPRALGNERGQDTFCKILTVAPLQKHLSTSHPL